MLSSLQGHPTMHPRAPRRRKGEKKKRTHHFLFGAEEGMALECLVSLALSDVRKHLIMHFISRAVRDPVEKSIKYTG